MIHTYTHCFWNSLNTFEWSGELCHENCAIQRVVSLLVFRCCCCYSYIILPFALSHVALPFLVVSACPIQLFFVSFLPPKKKQNWWNDRTVSKAHRLEQKQNNQNNSMALLYENMCAAIICEWWWWFVTYSDINRI